MCNRKDASLQAGTTTWARRANRWNWVTAGAGRKWVKLGSGVSAACPERAVRWCPRLLDPGYTQGMGRPLRKLTEEALALPEADRIALASELIESGEGGEGPEWEAAWLAELELRRKQGHADAVPWPEARDRILAGLDRK